MDSGLLLPSKFLRSHVLSPPLSPAQKKPASKMLQHWPRLGGRGNRPQPGSGRGEDGVTLRLLSARLHKTKELRNEVCELQRELASARVENKMLKQLQYRHMKALVKFEHEQSNLPQLLSRHETEVRMLKELLRRSQEQDRCVSRQLREAEGELWKTRETLHKLKLLCSKANLAERDELTSRIALLSQKLDSEQDRIQDLEKSLSINTKNFNHLLAAERTKTREANELIKKLQSEQRALHQTITVFLLKDVIEEEEGEKQTEPEDQRNAVERLPELGTELGESSGLNESFNKGITRLRRRYRFTEQIENLHQGLPVCKMSTYASHACSKRRLSGLEFPELASSFSGYEPSFGKMCGRAKKGLLLPPPRQDKKSSLIETLFGSATGLENKPSAPGGGVKTPDTLAHLQMNKQNHTSRIQVPNKNRLNILDPNLLPGRVLDASTEDNENLILQ
uniref:Lebercilin-like protein n=1 Tax=Callorhinchus milii TaxID=7868 RepID=A0A4W3H4W6_CALMI